MSFLFVDQILDLFPGGKTTGLKYVTLQDTYLTHSGDGLTLRPSILGEALGQLCSWNVLQTTHYRFRPVGGVIQEIQLFNRPRVGDVIFLESNIENLDEDNLIVSFSGSASINGNTLFIVKNSLAPLLPLEEFNDRTEVKKNFAKLREPFCPPPEKKTHSYYKVSYDRISIQAEGKEISANAMISAESPYFRDHFPKKPVLPLSLLMEYNLELAHLFLSDLSTKWRPVFLRKVKIGNFVLPNDLLTTRIILKEQTEKQILLNFHNSVNGKKVCVGEAEFGLS